MKNKLKIKNYTKLAGQPLPYVDWFVDMVHESVDNYSFLCGKGSVPGHLINIRLSRVGEKWPDGIRYHFYRLPGDRRSCITPDWFADMDNVKSAIADELKHIIVKGFVK